MRFGLIGYGAWGRFHAGAIGKATGTELVACASAGTVAEARQHHTDTQVYLDWRALLADRAIDTVVPNHLHAEIAIAALEVGKDVLLEKPMACTVADCDPIFSTVRRCGRVLSVGHEFRTSTQWGRFSKNPSYKIQLSAEKAGAGRSKRVPILLYFRSQDTELTTPLKLAQGD